MKETKPTKTNEQKSPKQQHFHVLLTSSQRESDMQQNSCSRHSGYQAHVTDDCVSPEQAYMLGDSSYVWLVDCNLRTTAEHILDF